MDKFGFLDQICLKRVILIENRKIEQHYWILHIRISLGTKFLNKLRILIFWTNFAQKRYFCFKIEKVNISTEFCIFELV